MVVKHPSVCEVEKPLSASFPVIPNDPLMSGHVRTLTGSLISGLNQTGAIAGAFADSSGEGSSNYAGGVYHSLWRSFRASRSVATYGRIYSGVTVDAVYVLIIIKT